MYTGIRRSSSVSLSLRMYDVVFLWLDSWVVLLPSDVETPHYSSRPQVYHGVVHVSFSCIA